MQRVRTMTVEAARLFELTAAMRFKNLETVRALALDNKATIFVNGGSTYREHYVFDMPRFAPALQEAIARLERLQMSCDLVINNGAVPSEEFVQAMKLLCRQPLQLAPSMPRTSVSFPHLSDPENPFKRINIQLSCL